MDISKKELVWKKPSHTVPFVRLVVIQKKKFVIFLIYLILRIYINGYSVNNSNSWLFLGSTSRLCVSVHDYYCYKFQILSGIFNPILYGKRLFQQFAVDTYIKIESSRLDYIRNHQYDIRADLYLGLVDSLYAGEGRVEVL